MDTHAAVARRILDLARGKKYSINRLADFAGVDRGALSRILRQQNSPTLRTLEKLAEALEVKVRDLFGDEEGED